MLATFKENYQSFFSFQKCNLSSRILFIIVCRIAMAISRAHSFRHVSLSFSWYS